MSPIVQRATAPSVLGGSITLQPDPCRHDPAVHIHPWTGEPGTAGTVAVVGAGKMGLPLAAQFASHDWSVIAVDIDPAVVAAINEGRSHLSDGARARGACQSRSHRREAPRHAGRRCGGR